MILHLPHVSSFLTACIRAGSLVFLLPLIFTPCTASTEKSRRIAIIGGGVGGSFAAKYLSDYDAACALDVVNVFEPSSMMRAPSNVPKGEPVTGETDGITSGWQGSRVSSITLSDETIVELGASIIFDGNRLVVEMMDGDPLLQMGKPFYPGVAKAESEREREKALRSGFGIYDGAGDWLINTANMYSFARKFSLVWRYNVDLFRINRAASQALISFDLIYDLLGSDRPATYLNSADQIWDAVGLHKLAKVSYSEFLDAIGVCHDVQWWRSFLPYQGCIRPELLSAATINNYNQEVSRMNGLAGLVSFIPTKGKLFSVEGGNYQLISSALKQAQKRHAEACESDGGTRFHHVQKKVTTIIGDLESGMEVFSGEENLGHYDIVVLAAPLQHCDITFLVRSHLDSAVLQPMPLSGMVDSDVRDANDHQHNMPSLPSSASRPYTQVVTTVLSNGELQGSYFNLTNSDAPRSIYFSERGRDMEGITTITHLTSDGTFKVFSLMKLSDKTLESIFGSAYRIEYEKIWGGDHGGATPDFDGGGESSLSTPFLMYDGGTGTKGHGYGPALYYVNSVEASVAAIEISAIGAKNVAKLIASRLEFEKAQSRYGDEEL